MMQYRFDIKTKQGEKTEIKEFQKQQKHVVLAAILDELMQDAETLSVSVYQLDKHGYDMFVMSDAKTNSMSRHFDAELAAKEKAMLKEKAARARAEWLRKRQVELASEVR